MSIHLKQSILISCLLYSLSLPIFSEEVVLRDLINLSLDELANIKVVSASKVAETTEHAAATVYVITEEMIRQLGLRDLKEVLAIMPGVDTIDNHFFLQGGQRGFMGPFSQSLILINGREMNNLIAGETFISHQFRTHNIKQIEVIAGPASALYGANAVGGLINLITKTPTPINGAEITISYDSNQSLVIEAVFGQTYQGWKLGGSFAAYQSDEENFADFLSNTQLASPAAENNPYRHLPHQYGYDNDSSALPISFYLEKQGFYLGSEYYRNRSGRGTASIQWDYNRSEDYRELWMKYGGYQASGLLAGKLDLRLEYRHYWERFWGNHTESTGTLENPFTGEQLTTATIEDVENFRGFYSNKNSHGSRRNFALLEGLYHWSEISTSIIGIDYDSTNVVSAVWSRTDGPHPPLSESNYNPEFRNDKWEWYLQHENHFLADTLFLTLGLRWVEHQRYGKKVLPRLGLVFEPVQGTIFKSLYGRSFREPSVFELSSNPAIQPMVVDTYELSWHQYIGSYVKNEAVIFFNTAQDRIVSNDVTSIANGGKLQSQGFENLFSFKYHALSGFLNYTYLPKVETTDNGITEKVYDIPQHKANLALTYHWSEGTSLGILGRYRSKVETEYQQQLYAIDHYLVWDMTWRTNQLPWLSKGMTLAITTKNLFNQTYYHPEPRDSNALQHPQEGRSIGLTWEMTLP